MGPNNSVVQANLGSALRQRGRLDETIQVLHKAIQHQPTWALPYFWLGQALEEKKATGQAIQAYRDCIARDPGVAEAHYNLGMLLGEKGEADAAQQAFEGAVRANPNHLGALINLGVMHGNANRFDQAIAFWTRACAVAAPRVDVCMMLGHALRLKGQLQESVAAHRLAMCRQPDSPVVCKQLAAILREAGHPSEADEAEWWAKQLTVGATRKSKGPPTPGQR